jgi:3-dehydroquinate synthase
VRRGHYRPEDAVRVIACLSSLGLPTALPPSDPARLVQHMAQDKKRSAGSVPFVLVRGIGEAFLARDVSLADVELFLAEELLPSPRRSAA